MDNILKQILSNLESLNADIKEMKPKVEEIYNRKEKIDESHVWLGVLYKANEFHKAEID
ncbi:MAG: hypothetical protein ACYDG6_04670 [Thermincolia bacterium]